MSTRSRLNGGVSRSVYLATAAVALSAAGNLFAADKLFTGASGTPADYNTAANWNPTGVPVAGDKPFIFGGSIATFSAGTGAFGDASIGADGASHPGTGELRISGGGLTASGGIQLGHDAGTTTAGTIAISGGSLTAGQVVMGEAGTGDNKITVSAGSLTLNNESYLGANGNGSLLVSGTGTASVHRLNVANALGSTGVLGISGGTLNMTDKSYVGLRGAGTMNVSGGVVNGADIAFGQENDTDTGGPGGATRGPSKGTLNVTGGTANFGTVVLGEVSRGDNRINVSAGTLHTAGDLYVGANGVGTLTISGTGNVTIDNQLHGGAGDNGNATINMSGGTLSAANSYLLIGQNGTGVFNLSGGAVTANVFSVGQDPNGFGTGTQTGGSVRAFSTFVVGEVTQKNNTYTVSGGSIDIGITGLPANSFGLFIGSGKGKGTMTVSGTATVSVQNGITVGYGEGAASDGTLNISGGTFTTINSGDDGRARIGVFAGSTGRLNVTGGTTTFGGPILNGVAKDPTSFGNGAVGGTGLITVGGGSLTAAGLENVAGSSYTQTAGTATLGVVVGGGAMAVSGGTANVSRVTQASLSVTGAGTVKVANVPAGSRTASVVGSLTTGGTGKLDLGNNGLIIDYTGATSPIASVRTALQAGRIVGTLSPVDARQAVAYAEASAVTASALFGTPVDSTAVIVRTLLKGDANFSGNVNFDDLISLAQNYNGTNKVWTQGDFNYDGTVNFDDLIPLAQNYNQSVGLLTVGSAAFQSDWALARSLVPEPTGLLAIAASAGLVGRRRRLS